MAINLSGAATLHKNLIKELIHGSQQEVTIRLAPTRVSSGVNPIFGDFSRETSKTGTTKGPYKCLWYDAYSVKSKSSVTGIEDVVEKAMGQYREATAVAELWLDDVIVASGTTWFDQAQDVLYNGLRYDVLAYTPIGLSTVAPYIAVVVLKGGAGTND